MRIVRNEEIVDLIIAAADVLKRAYTFWILLCEGKSAAAFPYLQMNISILDNCANIIV